jgi:indolepyruvate ferredoxin oxidoreductase beta subunit
MNASGQRPTGILIAALGGEGGGVLAQWLVEAALAAGLPAQSTSIPGVAQRTGATYYYVEIAPVPAANGRAPVLCLAPVPGRVDVVVASELLEAARAIQAGFASAERTVLIASTGRALTTAEKMLPGDGRYDQGALEALATAHSRRLIALDMAVLARNAGTVVSAVMAGAIAASGALPLPREAFEKVIRSAGVGVDASLRGFAATWDAVTAGARSGARAVMSARPAEVVPLQAWPEPLRDIVALGSERLREYQDDAYVALYHQRVRRVLAAEQAADPQGVHAFAVTRETARFLALWMAFDDVIRVAALKTSKARFARVRRELGARDGDIVKVYDILRPGAAELAGLLPPWLARRVLVWDRRRRAKGRPWSLPMQLRSDGVLGLVAMRLLAALKPLRRHGSRYAEEQTAIEAWLAAVERGSREDWSLGDELARCGRLIKGYGETNVRAKQTLAHILAHLANDGSFTNAAARAAAIRAAREAALADIGAGALDQAFIAHGAPPRPVPAQPVQWIRRRAAAPKSRHVA